MIIPVFIFVEVFKASTFLSMPRVKLFDENEVLTKAMNLFWKQGYSATSVQDLVTHLGINRASLYDTFGDKEQLFKKSFELYRKTNLEGLIQFFDSHPNVEKGFSELFDIAIHQAILDKDLKGCFVVNMATELIPKDKKLLEVIESNKRDFENLFFEYLKKGKDNGQLKTQQDLMSLASFLFLLYNGLKVISKINPKKEELKRSIDLALTLVF
ncbi:TetR/AcrR family transcriptional regulator [Dyadobacter tibetensis]|uniref:TetR/AcrR family transcriptional regulator n=1 Tax=Dyadobacter tibetensis TaxID=1211851 RepID=UPI0004AFC7FE|nr:TetR/AcrR family transcriptional regulator [Dyadobacter tibetensis]